MSFTSSRIAAGLSLDDVAAEFKTSASVVREWERGTVSPPENVIRSLGVLEKFATQNAMEASLMKPVNGQKGVRRPGTQKSKVMASFEPEKLIKSKKRVADHGEVFTPDWLVEKMLDLVKGESERIDSKFLEPACGSGNFLVAVLKRKLTTVEAKYGKQPFQKKLWALQALACCYGIELLADNIAECRENMLEVFADYLGIGAGDDFYRAASHILSLNLVNGNAMTMQTVPPEGEEPGPIVIVEWTHLKAGKFNRRDFRLEVLTQTSGFNERWSAPDSDRDVDLFADKRLPYHQRGRDPIFVPVAGYVPMTVRELAAKGRSEA